MARLTSAVYIALVLMCASLAAAAPCIECKVSASLAPVNMQAKCAQWI